jgi:acyl-CoA reductase-like NAD-dependent aldehyde dehydrogenase
MRQAPPSGMHSSPRCTRCRTISHLKCLVLLTGTLQVYSSSLSFTTHSLIGIQVKTGRLANQCIPSNHSTNLCVYHEADQATVAAAIDGALAAKAEWENMPWNDRAAIFLKAADLVSTKYRYILMAATMLGQGKNAWQAEIDAAAEVRLINAYRFPNKRLER